MLQTGFLQVARDSGITVQRRHELSEILQLDDAAWVSARLIELLPLPLAQRQAWLESDDLTARLLDLKRQLL